MKIVTLNVAGIKEAMVSMRNAHNSWYKNDTVKDENGNIVIGPNDEELSDKLMKAGPVHGKHLRFIQVWANIDAPMYWWKEFDTYRMGVEKNSCSTMHKITSRPLDINDFEINDSEEESYFKNTIIPRLNNLILDTCNPDSNDFDRKIIWRKIIAELPSNYIQHRTVMMSYAALKNITKYRKDHKLWEWDPVFMNWIGSLPESWLIFGKEHRIK